jgi:SAM-dependent methyltransferase
LSAVSLLLVTAGLVLVLRRALVGAPRPAAFLGTGLLLLGTPLFRALTGDLPLDFAARFALAAVLVEAARGRLGPAALALGPLGVACLVPPAIPPGPSLDALFSSSAGVLHRSPALWLGLAGLALEARARRAGAVPALSGLALVLLLAPARVEAALPLCGSGLVAALARLREVVAVRPERALLAGGATLVAWNFLLMEQTRRNLVPRDDTVPFSTLAANAADLASRPLGNPLSWPAAWAFAWRFGAPPQRYDEVAGRALPGGRLAIGDPGPGRPLAGDSWGPRRVREGSACREPLGVARVLLPRGSEAPAALALRATGGTLEVALNDGPATSWTFGPVGERRTAAWAAWRRGLNTLALSGGACVVELRIEELPGAP